jgi:alpha-D-xyloside xylohydrolase
MHNLYPLVYNQAVFEVTQEVKGAGLVWARSGWAGMQRYPVCWSGDPASQWDSLAFTLRGGLSLGLSGVPFWSHDVGGYRGHPGEKLYIRWAQFGLFCSHTRCHGESQREPWFFGPRAVEIFRRYARLRYQLFPYLYSAAIEASQTGLPVIRAMPLAYPEDPNTYDKDLQYLFGPSILVAPVYDESDRRSVYLPEGTWFETWTGQEWEGPRSISLSAPIDCLPLFVRAGSIIPMIRPANRIPAGKIDPLILDIYPSGHFSYLLREDEGTTLFEGTSRDGRFDLSWEGPVDREFVVRAHLSWVPARAECRAASRAFPVSTTMVEAGVFQLELPAGPSGNFQMVRR